jgi:hypothetical protein
MRGGNGIAKEIAAPLQRKFRLDFQAYLLDAQVVPLAWPKHLATRSKSVSESIAIIAQRFPGAIFWKRNIRF